MYGTLSEQPGPSRPLLSEEEQQQQFSSQLSLHQKGKLKRRMSNNRPVLQGLLEKPHRRKSTNEVSPIQIDGSPEPNDDAPKPKSFVYTMLNPRSNSIQAVVFKWFLTAVIVLDLVIFVISTEPVLTDESKKTFYMWEGITSSIFLVEFVARLITVTESKKYGDMGQLWGRLKYCTTYPALIDIMATFPFFVELISSWDLPTLTYLRAFRLIRILKTSGFASATNAVYRVIYYNRQILYVAMLICIGLVIFTAVLMYYLRPQDPQDSQDFQSLGATMYLATLMLTGQGGPDGDLPWYTKGVVLLTGAFSIGMFAIPASMLTWGFEAEAERRARLAYSRSKTESTSPEADTWSFSSDDYSTDEEYRKIIAGGESEEDDDGEAQSAFRLADIDGSGNISLTEFLTMSREKAARDDSQYGGELISRISRLENRVEENSQKLDKIYHLLELIHSEKDH